ncbi:HPr family phosphocarrier protein [Tumebacillus flagellatus]|uniref:HPr domain-containing protein n=1 Tax=Tumebacillus flagellatus TaxID=1157490 RepID=A0A074LU90_9BACL|nr:HPr family phosphocarrier protein [Tumebacillus flagellatus]KEO84125.1 hypothetical protein EL26_06580 [Tumebacillus flagellatus]
MHSQQTTIQNEHGIHVRPAQLLVQTANKFSSDIKLVAEDGRRVEAKSILGIMTLGLTKGAAITIEANGADEEAAVAELVKLFESKFGEE